MEENNQNTNNTVVEVNTTTNGITANKNNNIVEIKEVKKPYEFRKLCSTDIPLMMKIITKIGLNKFANLLQKNEISDLFSSESGEKESNKSLILGGTLILDIAQIVLEGLGDCQEIFNLLEQTSNLSIDEIEKLDIDVLMEMIIDFIKKEEFVGFFKAVLKFIK